MSKPRVSFRFATSSSPSALDAWFASFLVAEDPFSFRHAQAKTENDLSLGIQPAGHARLDAVDRQRGNPGTTSELSLAEQVIFPKLLKIRARFSQ
jgi:hypothetical protein